MVITCKPSFFGIRRSSRRTSGEPIGQDGSHTQPDLEISLSSLAKPAMTKSCSVFSRISRSQDETSADNARRNRSIQHESKPHRFLCQLAFWHEKHPLQAGGVKMSLYLVITEQTKLDCRPTRRIYRVSSHRSNRRRSGKEDVRCNRVSSRRFAARGEPVPLPRWEATYCEV